VSAQVQRIELDAARAGMVLAGDLVDANGGVLLPDGATLSEANLASLRRRGVEACSVLLAAEEDGFDDPAARAARLAQQLRRLQRLFRRSAAEEATPLLLRLLTTYRENG
jgi:hypothetical protein